MIAICAVPAVAIAQILWKIVQDVQKNGKEGITKLPWTFWRIVTDLARHTDEWRSNELKATNEISEQNSNEKGYDNKAVNVD